MRRERRRDRWLTPRPRRGAHRHVHWLELLSTLLLALAAVATAWASYQASRWQGQQALAGNRSTAARVEANREAGVANRQIQTDIATFIQWVDAYAHDDKQLSASTSAASGRSSGRRSRRGSPRAR